MIPAVCLPELPGQQDRRRWAELSLSSPCREQGSVLRTRPSPHSLPLLLPSPPSRALPGLSNPSMMETRYNPVSQSVYPTSLPHARTGERERERERELSDLSQSGSGKAGMGTGEEDTAPRLSHRPPPPPPPPPPSLTQGQDRDIICAPRQSVWGRPRVTARIRVWLALKGWDFSLSVTERVQVRGARCECLPSYK